MSAVKIAGAPISWGVCEVPDWGHQLPRDRVLTEMREAGLSATELGPAGFLPQDPARLTALLDRYGLGCVGTFAPAVLHDGRHDPAGDVALALDSVVATGASTLVLAAATGADGYDSRPELNADQWSTLLSNLDHLADLAAQRGVIAVLHPHVGTMVESESDVNRVLSGSSIPLCLDTGHLLIGGCDPLRLAHAFGDRIAHVHLKDVDAALASRVRTGELTYTQAVARNMYTPLGSGDIDIAGIVTALRCNGFDGWFVLEQDTILSCDPSTEPDAAGPLRDVQTSVAYLHDVLRRVPA